MNKTELKKIVFGRLEKNIVHNVSMEYTTVQEEFYNIDTMLCFDYFRKTDQLDKLEEIYTKQFDELLKLFLENSNSLFYRQIDVKVIERLFFWMSDFYGFIVATDNIKFLKSHFPILQNVLHFFLHSTSSYVTIKNKTYLEIRTKNEFPFAKMNLPFVSSYINILWYNFLSIMNYFGMRLFDIKTVGQTEDLISYMEKTFVSLFWDEEEKFLRFSDSDFIPVFSSLSLWSIALNFNNLLFKQKKKKLLNTIETEFYTDTGLLLDLRKKQKIAELLPVFWLNYLKFYKFNSKSVETVKKWLFQHIESIDLENFEVDNYYYNRRFFEFLLKVRFDF